MRKTILKLIDFFYFPFIARWIPEQTFKYMVCGGTSTTVDLILFYVSFHYILDEAAIVHWPFIAVTGYIAAFLMAFAVSFPLGFILSKYVVFPGSYLRTRIQLVRYLLIVGCNIVLNYALLHFFVGLLHVYPTIAKLLVTIIVICFSYFAQRYFTFRMKPAIGQEVEADNNSDEGSDK